MSLEAESRHGFYMVSSKLKRRKKRCEENILQQ